MHLQYFSHQFICMKSLVYPIVASRRSERICIKPKEVRLPQAVFAPARVSYCEEKHEHSFSSVLLVTPYLLSTCIREHLARWLGQHWPADICASIKHLHFIEMSFLFFSEVPTSSLCWVFIRENFALWLLTLVFALVCVHRNGNGKILLHCALQLVRILHSADFLKDW